MPYVKPPTMATNPPMDNNGTMSRPNVAGISLDSPPDPTDVRPPCVGANSEPNEQQPDLPGPHRLYDIKLHFNMYFDQATSQNPVNYTDIFHRFRKAILKLGNDNLLLPFEDGDERNPIKQENQLPNDENDIKAYFYDHHLITNQKTGTTNVMALMRIK